MILCEQGCAVSASPFQNPIYAAWVKLEVGRDIIHLHRSSARSDLPCRRFALSECKSAHALYSCRRTFPLSTVQASSAVLCCFTSARVISLRRGCPPRPDAHNAINHRRCMNSRVSRTTFTYVQALCTHLTSPRSCSAASTSSGCSPAPMALSLALWMAACPAHQHVQ